MYSKTLTFILIASGTILGLAGTDLVLPAIPVLPNFLDGNLATAQWVLAAFAAGTGIGLLIYGELGSRVKMGNLLVISLLSYATISYLATFSSTLYELSLARFFQGVVAAGPAVFAPVMVKSMYKSTQAITMLGRIGSIESITPALAPILGAWLLGIFDWKSSFYLTTAIALILSIMWLCGKETRQSFGQVQQSSGGYRSLVGDKCFLRYALSQAFSLGAMIIIVFAAPTIITQSMGGELSDFITMQILGITLFVISANSSHRFIKRFGEEKTIFIGSSISALGCITILSMGLSSYSSIVMLWGAFMVVNLGFGIRGPVGFYKALQAAGTNESRGSALILLLVMFTAAVGTVLVSPFVQQGISQVAALATLVSLSSVWLSSSLTLPRVKLEKVT